MPAAAAHLAVGSIPLRGLADGLYLSGNQWRHSVPMRL